MKTQSPDTSLDAELVLIEMIRKAPIHKRFAFVQSWTASMFEAGVQYIWQLYPHATDEEVKLLFIERQYGKELTDELRRALNVNGIQLSDTPEYQKAIRPLVKLFEELDVPYALSGSLASSLYGLQRATLQVDFIADLNQKHFLTLFTHLKDGYWLQRETIEAALMQQSSFPLVHLETLLKVTITLPGNLSMGQQVFHRVRNVSLIEGTQPTTVLSPEQTILLLLETYKNNDGRDDDVWYDLLGIAKVQGAALDIPFLAQQSAALGDTTLLKRMLIDAGLQDK